MKKLQLSTKPCLVILERIDFTKLTTSKGQPFSRSETKLKKIHSNNAVTTIKPCYVQLKRLNFDNDAVPLIKPCSIVVKRIRNDKNIEAVIKPCHVLLERLNLKKHRLIDKHPKLNPN